MPSSKTKHRRTYRPAPAGSAVGGIASTVVHKPTAGLSATTLHDCTLAGASVGKRSSALSESSSESTNSSSESSDSEDTSSDSDRRHRRRRSAKRHLKHLRSAHSHSYPQVLASPFISCVPTPDKRAIRKIKKGKYVLFDKLLPPLDDGQVGQPIGGQEGHHQAAGLGRAYTSAPGWRPGTYLRPLASRRHHRAGEISEHHLPALRSILNGSGPQGMTISFSRLWLGTSCIRSAGTYSRRAS